MAANIDVHFILEINSASESEIRQIREELDKSLKHLGLYIGGKIQEDITTEVHNITMTRKD